MLDIQCLVYVKGCVLEPRQEARLLQNYNAKMEKNACLRTQTEQKDLPCSGFPTLVHCSVAVNI